MTSDPFASSTFPLVLAWISAVPLLIAAMAFPFSFFGGEFKGYRTLLIWFGLCLIALSPIRYLLFLVVAGISYCYQSWGAFFSTFILAIYIPIVFGVLYCVGIGIPFLAAQLAIGKHETISFDRGILAAVLFPIGCVISSCIFYVILPFTAWSIAWLKTSDIIKATNGPAAIVFHYVASPFSPIRLPALYHETPQQPQDLLRCHVASTYLTDRKIAYFVKKQYPDIYAKAQSGPRD